MSQLKEIIQIDKRFQSSINIQLDLQDQQKWNSYIPTRSSVSVLYSYLTHIDKERDKANILIGPYGKGKSHLLLVLLALISAKETRDLEGLIHKIGQIDLETASLIQKIREEHRPFLPVLVSGTAGDLQQAFLLGLAEALKREGLSEIAPGSYYTEAVRTIEIWEEEYPQTYQHLEELLEEKQLSGIRNAEQLKQCIAQGGSNQEKAYQFFVKLYPKLTAGAKFNPIIEVETLKLYKDMNHILCEKYGYGGIYIIFDEFSKYIEGHGRENFARDMKIIQDMCELSQNSKGNQIHLTMVAHKSLKEYGNTLPKDMVNAYVGVEGRIKEERFVLSAQNNYELIANVIQKKGDGYLKDLEDIREANELAYQQIPGFCGVLEWEEYEQLIVKGCFPMLPLTAYCLLAISEKVAQNERSIFTFLANEEKGSLLSLISKEREEDQWQITADVIYDYFKNLFRESTDLTAIHAEWLKAEYALSHVETKKEKRFIKCLALLRMLKRPEEIPMNDDAIRLATGMDAIEYEITKEGLIQKQIILYRSKIRTYAFKNNVGLDLEKEIRELALKKQVREQLDSHLERIWEIQYELPKQYNQTYSMTRYFHYMFLDVRQFLKLQDSQYLFDEKRADGKILALTWQDDPQKEAVLEHLKELDDPRIVILLPEIAFEEEERLKRLLAVEDLLKDPQFIEQNKVLKQELEIYQEDLIFELNAVLEKLYAPKEQNCIVADHKGSRTEFVSEKQFNRYLSEICTRFYEKAPKINNELINRMKVSTQIRKARAKLLTQILQEEDLSGYEKGTSPEATIYRAVLKRTGVIANEEIPLEDGCEKVLQEIRIFMQESVGKKQCFQILYDRLEGEGYGMRRGIVPIFLAREFAQLTDMPILYLEEKEVGLRAEILANINDRPKEHFLYIERSSMEKELYLKALEELFLSQEQKKRTVGKSERLSILVEYMQKWTQSLSQYTRMSTRLTIEVEQEKALKRESKMKKICQAFEIEQIIMLRRIFHDMELNPREILFEKIPNAFLCKEEGLSELAEKIQCVKLYLDHHLSEMEHIAAECTKQMFGARAEESLHGCLMEWYSTLSQWAKNCLLQDQTVRVMNCLQQLHTHDECEIIKKLSKAVIDIHIEDWNDRSLDQYLKEFEKIREQAKNMQGSKEEENRAKISFTDSQGELIEKYYDAQEEDSTSYFLSNAIEEAMEEFGDTLETNQKVSVLIQALERLIKEN